MYAYVHDDKEMLIMIIVANNYSQKYVQTYDYNRTHFFIYKHLHKHIQ
jgi:hypothetical protein